MVLHERSMSVTGLYTDSLRGRRERIAMQYSTGLLSFWEMSFVLRSREYQQEVSV